MIGVCSASYGQFHTNRLTNTTNTTSATAGPPGSEVSNYNNNSEVSNVVTDSTQGFSIKRMVRGFARKDTLTPGYLTLGTVVLPGIAQAYNKQYWKMPIVYCGIGAGIYGGIHFNSKYHETGDSKYKTYRTLSYVGAGLFYWGQILDGVVNLKTTYRKPVPAKATIYSALLPGLGQAYNGDWWKIPIWYGGFAACGYFFHINNIEYQRFKYIYDMDSHKETTGYIGNITASQCEWYKTTYRKYRDYSVVAFALIYILNIVDANVFAHMHDFDVSDNIASIQIEPTVITPDFAYSSPAAPQQALGLNLKFNF